MLQESRSCIALALASKIALGPTMRPSFSGSSYIPRSANSSATCWGSRRSHPAITSRIAWAGFIRLTLRSAPPLAPVVVAPASADSCPVAIGLEIPLHPRGPSRSQRKVNDPRLCLVLWVPDQDLGADG